MGDVTLQQLPQVPMLQRCLTETPSPNPVLPLLHTLRPSLLTATATPGSFPWGPCLAVPVLPGACYAAQGGRRSHPSCPQPC